MLFDNRIQVLRWPIGKKAGFCFANDAEYLTLSGFKVLESTFSAIMELPNCLSTSIFLVNSDINDPAMSLLDNNCSPSSDLPSILDLVKTGKIDGVHALGNFDSSYFDLEGITKGVQLITGNKLQLSWWSNHGNKNNKQNLGATDLLDYQEGDLPESKYYSKNSADALGIIFFWLDDSIATKNDILREKIFKLRTLRNGQEISTFLRYRGLFGKPAPTLESLAEQLSENLLEEVLFRKTGISVYQHLGISRRKNGHIAGIVNSVDDIPGEAIDVFLKISLLNKKGLWVTNTTSYLNFNFAIKNLNAKYIHGKIKLDSNSKTISLHNVSLLSKNKLEIDQIDYDSNFIKFKYAESERIKANKYVLTFFN